MSKQSKNLRREYESMGKPYPGDAAAARQQLQLARECTVKAHALDPSLAFDAPPSASPAGLPPQSRPVTNPSGGAPLALDAATEEKIIARAIRTARQMSAPRSTSRGKTMRSSTTRPNMDALFQRDPNSPRDHGPAFASVWDSRNSPRKVSRRAFAFDAEAATETALKHLDDAKTHIEACATGNRDYDKNHFCRMLKQAIDAMAGAEEDGEEAEDNDRPFDDGKRTAEERERAATGKDDVGETPARSIVELPGGKNPDHRKDFNDIKQGGADSALFDPATLFQRI